jgi:hypothetical protein
VARTRTAQAEQAALQQQLWLQHHSPPPPASPPPAPDAPPTTPSPPLSLAQRYSYWNGGAWRALLRLYCPYSCLLIIY